MPNYLVDRYVLKIETVLVEDVENKEEAESQALSIRPPKVQHSEDLEVQSIERVYQ